MTLELSEAERKWLAELLRMRWNAHAALASKDPIVILDSEITKGVLGKL